MFRYLLRRIAIMFPLIIVVTAFVFLLGQYGAGDMAMAITLRVNNGTFDATIYETLKRELGLDQPIMIRFGHFLAGAVRWDFGRSYVIMGTPDIGKMMLAALPITAQLAAGAVIIIVLLGIPLGILAAVGRNTVLDHGIVALVTVLSSIPPFVLVPVAMVLLVVRIKLLPTVGTGWRGILHEEAVFAAACLAIGPLFGIVRYTRAQVLEVLPQEYLSAARARGVPEWRVVTSHVLKNALTPVVTVLGTSVGYLLSAAIFVEVALGYRGFGWLAFRAFQGGDIQTVAAATLVSASMVMLANLLVDLLYGVLDPRVHLGWSR